MSVIAFLQNHPLLLIISATFFGMCAGSFLNVVIYRLPKMMHREWHEQCCELLEVKDTQAAKKPHFNLIFPRSFCPLCQHQITALENIPIISYLYLKGRCNSCNAKISVQYPIIEILSGMGAAYIAYQFGISLQGLLAALLTWVLICLSMIDIKHTLLPDNITLPVLWLGLAINMFAIFTDIYSSLMGAIMGYTILWLVFMLFKIVTGKEGMGYGDFKLLALLGAWLGWQMLPVIILLSSVSAVLIRGIMIIFGGKNKMVAFPFGPYLAFSGWVSLIWGSQLIEMYLRRI